MDSEDILTLPDGRKLAYRLHGGRKGIPVFMFHGVPGSRLAPALIYRKAFPDDVLIIAPDRPGFGLSDYQPGRTIAHWPDDVAALADHLGLDKFAVAGASGGGPYTLACCWKMPERITAAAVVSPMAPVTVPEAKKGMDLRTRALFWAAGHMPFLLSWYAERLARKVKEDPEVIVTHLRRHTGREDNRIIDRAHAREFITKDAREAFRHGGAGPAHELSLFARPWPFPVEDIETPVQLWHGEADSTVPVTMGRYLARHLPNCHATFIPNAGHLWIIDHMQDLLDYVIKAARKNGAKARGA